MKSKLLLPALIIFGMVHAAPPVEEGKTIFTSRCAGCHSIDKVLTGPALAGVDQRRSMDWIISFVHSSQKVIKSGDKEAVALFEQFNRIPMPDHADLTDDHIKSVVAFIKSETEAAARAKSAPKAEPQEPTYLSVVLTTPSLLAVYLSLLSLLIGAIYFLVKVRALRRKSI